MEHEQQPSSKKMENLNSQRDQEGRKGKKGENNSERYVPEDNKSRVPITTHGIWLNLEKTLD